MLSTTASLFLSFRENTSLFLHRFPRPVTVEPMDQYDDEEGLPEKLVIKNQQYHKYVSGMQQERRVPVGKCPSLRRVAHQCSSGPPFFFP